MTNSADPDQLASLEQYWSLSYFSMKTYHWYPLEVPYQGTSNEYLMSTYHEYLISTYHEYLMSTYMFHGEIRQILTWIPFIHSYVHVQN